MFCPPSCLSHQIFFLIFLHALIACYKTTDVLPAHTTVIGIAPGNIVVKQRSVLKRTCSTESSEMESAPPAQKIRVEKEASFKRVLTAPALLPVPVPHLNPSSTVTAAAAAAAAAATNGKVVEVKRSHQKGASMAHQKKLAAASQAAIPTPLDIPLLLSSTSSLPVLPMPVNSLTTSSAPTVCSRVALGSILKGDPLTSIAYQTFSGTRRNTCHRVEYEYEYEYEYSNLEEFKRLEELEEEEDMGMLIDAIVAVLCLQN